MRHIKPSSLITRGAGSRTIASKFFRYYYPKVHQPNISGGHNMAFNTYRLDILEKCHVSTWTSHAIITHNITQFLSQMFQDFCNDSESR
jgi:hypothetical protein